MFKAAPTVPQLGLLNRLGSVLAPTVLQEQARTLACGLWFEAAPTVLQLGPTL